MPGKAEHPLCRRCGGFAPRAHMVNPSKRYFYHPDCYLKTGRMLGELPASELRNFTIQQLRDAGLLSKALGRVTP